ncbi:MAG: hypothetical protein Q8P25_05025 [Candidatus Curtissbacteria bacterium]|nr:hypothetical protein [Candidatus Curtissbacteria bacterium]
MQSERITGLISKIDRAKANLMWARESVGTPSLTKGVGSRLNLAEIDDPDRLIDATLEVAKIRERIDQALPRLESRREGFLKAGERLNLLREKADAGLLTQEEYERVENVLLGRNLPKKSAPAELREVPLVDLPKNADLSKENELLPAVHIDLNSQVIAVDGRVHKFRKGRVGAWEGFLKLARHANEFVDGRELTEVRKASGVIQERNGSLIYSLRQAIEPDPKNPNIILTEGTKRAKYKLKARVEAEGLVDFDFGRVKGLRRQDRKIIDFLRWTSAERPLSGEELSRDIYGFGVDLEAAKNRLSVHLGVLRKKLLEYGYQIVNLNLHGSKKGGLYYLLKVDETSVTERDLKLGEEESVTEPETAARRREYIWKHNPVQPDRLEALAWVINNPDADIREVLKLFAPSEKTGRRLPANQAWIALANANNFLQLREANGLITDSEKPYWEKMEEFLRNKRIEPYRGFREYLYRRFYPKIEIVQEPEASHVSVKEAAILATLFYIRKDFLKESGLEPIPEEIPLNLCEKLEDLENVTIEDLNTSRREIIQKLLDAKGLGVLDDLMNKTEDLDIQLLLLYFWDYEERQGEGLLLSLLERGDTFWQSDMRDVVAVWKEWQKTGFKQKRDSVEDVSPGAPTLGEIASHPLVRGGVTPVADVVSAKPVPALEQQREKASVRMSGIEKRDPEVHTKIQLILDEIGEKGITGPLRGNQLTRYFHNLTRFDMSKLLEKGHVLPVRGNDHHPMYTIADIALAVYLKRNRDGLPSRQIFELRAIIKALL